MCRWKRRRSWKQQLLKLTLVLLMPGGLRIAFLREWLSGLFAWVVVGRRGLTTYIAYQLCNIGSSRDVLINKLLEHKCEDERRQQHQFSQRRQGYLRRRGWRRGCGYEIRPSKYLEGRLHALRASTSTSEPRLFSNLYPTDDEKDCCA